MARHVSLGSAREYTGQQEYHRVVAVLRNVVRADELANLMTAGAAMTENQAIEEALQIR